MKRSGVILLNHSNWDRWNILGIEPAGIFLCFCNIEILLLSFMNGFNVFIQMSFLRKACITFVTFNRFSFLCELIQCALVAARCYTSKIRGVVKSKTEEIQIFGARLECQ